MIILCKMMGGSHAYGLNTTDSDIDLRGIFLNDTISDTIGLSKFEHLNLKTGEDTEYYEFRNYLRMLRKTNTQCMELLFNQNWLEIDERYADLQANKTRLIASKTLLHCMKGYMGGELKLANGERTGKLGGKRKAALDKYGFSPRNFVHILRLGWCAAEFFLTGNYPVNVMQANQTFGKLLLDIKTHPENYTVDQLNKMAAEAIAFLTDAYSVRKVNYKFDQSYADELCLRMYYPVIQQFWTKIAVP
jgi:hypothetical protein